MSVIEVAVDGAPAALVIATPTTLTTETTAGVYQAVLDMNNLAANDLLIVRSKIKVVSGGTSRVLEEYTLAGVTAQKIMMTEPIPIAWEVIYELEQVAGTGRSIPYSILRS